MPDRTRKSDAAAPAAGKTDWSALDQMSGDEIESAALADPDAPPLPEGKPMRKMARVKRLRLALRLSQSEFATRYRIPLEILVAWERHDSEPDAVARAFLDAISADAEGVARALAAAAAE